MTVVRRWCWALWLGVAVLGANAAVAPSAAAAPKPLAQSLTGDAKEAYESARLLFNDQQWDAARLKFERAYEVSGDPRLLWNVAACHRAESHYGRVVQLLERYLRDGGDAVSETDRREAQQVIDKLRPLVSRVTVRSRVDGAEVLVDGERMGVTPLGAPLLLDTGTRRIRLSKKGYRDTIEVRSIEGGTDQLLDLALVASSGRLTIVAGTSDAITVDGEERSLGRWEGELSVGIHQVRVVRADGETHSERIAVADGDKRHVDLGRRDESAEEDQGVPLWVWIGGSAAVAAGLAVGGYFLFKPDDPMPSEQSPGTLGIFELP